MMTKLSGIRYIDSHTEGEPTRVIVEGGPDLGSGSLQERLKQFRENADHLRCCVIHEPRGWDAVVGALICEPTDPSCAAGVIFFNNTGYLGMCGHGAIGVGVTLHYLGRIGLGKQKLETPVGIVEVDLLEPNRVAIGNVPSYRLASGVSVEVDGMGIVTGDVAWGGNWFFLIGDSPVEICPENMESLSDATKRIRVALEKNNITGENGAEIDHIELFGPPSSPAANSRSFVLCPGGAYDRSPCGTGTSAKLACLAADGKLAPGETWIQESVIGSSFEGSYQDAGNGQILPRIVGTAYICSEGKVVQQEGDPFAFGI
jgi:4-hydroxyproline epimerase